MSADQDYIDFVIEYKNGKKEITVVNGKDVKCSDIPTDEIVRKLMGENVQVTDFARTDQYYDEQARKKPIVHEDNEESFVQRREFDEKEKRQQIDL